MLNFRKAKEAFAEIRSLIGRAQKDPINWDIALGLHATVEELDRRLANIEQSQAEILRLLRSR
jgi:hypothetical protein